MLKSCPEIRLGAGRGCRRFLEAVLLITRNDSQWRLLPKQYGKGNSVFKRFDHWSEIGIFEKLSAHLSQELDLEHLLIDSTVVRAHACSAGVQSLGLSRGGFSTKIHLTCEALGNAIRFILTGGEQNDITQAAQLIENFSANAVLADKGYDANDFISTVISQNSIVVIPSKTNRKVQCAIDAHLYK